MQSEDTNSGPIVWIDVHTGLGIFGKDTLLFEQNRKDKIKLEELQKLFPTAEHIVTPSVVDKRAMAGYEKTRGIMANWLKSQYPSGMFLVSIKLSF